MYGLAVGVFAFRRDRGVVSRVRSCETMTEDPIREVNVDGKQASPPQDLSVLPPGLPVPTDDGAAEGLVGLKIPDLVLPSSMGDVALAEMATQRLVLYVYPQTGPPGKPTPPGWDLIPGARGCTPEACGFRDHAAELAALGATVAGLSGQPLPEQEELAARLRMPFPIVSDEGFELQRRLELPTFELEGARFYKRLTLIAEAGTIVKVFYPVFPPDRHAEEIVAWLQSHRPPVADGA